ncbi:F-box only protein 10 [Varanus komodoensis]|nr:F-box only protein 10 [Varanus komodoensis]
MFSSKSLTRCNGDFCKTGSSQLGSDRNSRLLLKNSLNGSTKESGGCDASLLPGTSLISPKDSSYTRCSGMNIDVLKLDMKVKQFFPQNLMKQLLNNVSESALKRDKVAGDDKIAPWPVAKNGLHAQMFADCLTAVSCFVFGYRCTTSGLVYVGRRATEAYYGLVDLAGLLGELKQGHSWRIIMLKNDIHHCKTSGIFLRLGADGLIAENNIYSNCEAGVDIRKGANPFILCNRIHSGLRSGIVVLGNGKGIIRSNQIYGNKEAGIYILYNGNPLVSGNHIFQGLAAGIAVNENGRGQITENVIRENQWGGADIRRGGDPVLRSNLICCGYSDGVVVGERGKGLIEGNTIYGNKGCGVWIMSSSLPHITNNQIGHNSIYGIAVFCRKDDANDYLASQGGNENFNDEGEATNWENDPESEDECVASRRPISVALVESNNINHNGAAGLYVKSSEALNIVGNAIHANQDCGVTVLQSSQLTRIANNSISCNSLGGVLVEAECRVELRGNGIYDNSSHGVTSRGEGLIAENDILGNQGSGLKLLQAADMKVTRNRIHSFRGYGIEMLDQTKAFVQDNLIFQGKSKKGILQQVSSMEGCVVLNNKLLAFKKRSDVGWTLENPPARPHIEGSSRGLSTAGNSQKGSSMTARLAARVDGGCHNNGSIFCTIL